MLLLDLLIELLDAVLTIVLFSFICTKVSFPWSILLIGLVSLPLVIGIIRGLVRDADCLK